MKVLLGSGNKRIEGWMSLDIQKDVNPDFIHDLSKYPWPFDDNAVDELICSHVLEHVIEQGKADQFFSFFRELWRICKNGAICRIVVPDAMSEHAFSDPWHKSFYTKNIFSFVSKKSIKHNLDTDTNATPCNIDFDFDIEGLNILDGDIHVLLKVVK